MTGKRSIDRLMRETIERGKARERAKALAALSLVVREGPGNLVAFLWLARCYVRTEARVPRSTAPTGASRSRR